MLGTSGVASSPDRRLDFELPDQAGGTHNPSEYGRMARQRIGGRSIGPLESAVLKVLWTASEPQGVREVLDSLSGPPRAYTTVMTILGRLTGKGLVIKIPAGHSFRYQAAGNPDELAAQAIAELLSAAQDPQAVLARAVERVDDAALIAQLTEVVTRGREA